MTRNLLDKGGEFLDAQRHEHMSDEVEYVRGELAVRLRATVGRSVFEQEDQSGVIVRSETRDYIVRAADLRFGGVPVEPAAGDRIVDSTGRTFVVHPPGRSVGGEPVWRLADPFRRAYRVHTKEVAS